MTKQPPIFLLAVAALILSACGGLGGGPDTATLEKIAREQMVAGVGPQGNDPAKRKALEEAAAAATITKKGICGVGKNNVYGCAVDVTAKLPGAAAATTQTLMVTVVKGADGQWKASE